MILYLGKNYNDLDSLVPVIDQMCRTTKEEIVLSMVDSSYNYKDDFRLNYLRETHDLSVIDFYRDTSFGVIKRFLLLASVALTRSTPYKTYVEYGFAFLRQTLLRVMTDNATAKFYKLPEVLEERYFGVEYSTNYLKELNPSIIVSDNRIRPVALYESAVNLGIPLVGIPHGLDTIMELNYHKPKELLMDTTSYWYENDRRKDIELKKKKKDPFHHYTLLLTQNSMEKQRWVFNGTSPEKIIEAGSTRYCPEWRSIYSKIVPQPKVSFPKNSDRVIKVVFMDHKPGYEMEQDNILSGIRAIQSLDFVELIVKPSTGYVGKSRIRPSSSYHTRELGDFCRIDATEHSYNLIDWADVVIVSRSSIWLEVLLQKKIFIYPSNFIRTTNICERYHTCWRTSTTQELVDALTKIRKQPSYRPYSDENVQQVLDYLIRRNPTTSSVLEQYVKNILDVDAKTGVL